MNPTPSLLGRGVFRVLVEKKAILRKTLDSLSYVRKPVGFNQGEINCKERFI